MSSSRYKIIAVPGLDRNIRIGLTSIPGGIHFSSITRSIASGHDSHGAIWVTRQYSRRRFAAVRGGGDPVASCLRRLLPAFVAISL